MGLNLPAERAGRELAARRELFAVLAHEFRSPIGAILGFEELLSEGIFGEVSEAGRDALARVRSSARQLLDLAAGLNDLSGATSDEPVLQRAATQTSELLAGALEAIELDAAGRDTHVRLTQAGELPVIITNPERVQRALRLALMAAVKVTAGGTIVLRAEAAGGGLLIELEGSALDPQRDEPDLSLNATDQPRLTGAGLRIAMARHALEPLHGQLSLQVASSAVTLRLQVPALERD